MRAAQKLLALVLALCLLGMLTAGLAETAADAPSEGDIFDLEAGEDAAFGEDAVPDDASAVGASDEWGLQVYYLDLGRVDGILIACEGEYCFIDVGMKQDAPPAIKYLQALGIDHLDSYIGSHGHADHIGGAARIINAFKPKTLYVNRPETVQAMLESAEGEEIQAINAARSVVVRSGDTFNIGRAQVKCLGPRNIRNCSMANQKENYNSLILRMDYFGHSFLFTGDTMDANLTEANKDWPGELDVDVFKNPHHNGAHDGRVIGYVKPKITVFCTDNENQPIRKYQRLLREAGSAVYITGTEKNGNVVIDCNETQMRVRLGYALDSLQLQTPPTLYVGQQYTLKGSIMPEDRARANWVGWQSSDESTVSVESGVVRALKQGSATITATSFNGLTAAVPVEVYSALVELEHDALKLGVGGKAQLRARLLPEDATGVSGEWFCEDESIVSCTSKGVITGISQGETRVIARLSNGAEAACKVTVEGYNVDKIKLDRKKATMSVGDTLQLAVATRPSIEGMQFSWASSDEKILWVDSNGNVTAVGKGTAKIGVKAVGSDKYAVCTIKVK